MMRTPSTSMIVMSCPSIQKKNAAKAEVLTIRRRYVLPGYRSILISAEFSSDSDLYYEPGMGAWHSH